MRNALRNGLVILTLAAVATLGTSCKKKTPTTERENNNNLQTSTKTISRKIDSPYGLYSVVSFTQIDEKDNRYAKKIFDIRELGLEKSGEYIELREGEYTYLRPERPIKEKKDLDTVKSIPYQSMQIGHERKIEGGRTWTVLGDNATKAIEMREKPGNIYEIIEVPKSSRYYRHIREVKRTD